MLIWWGAQATVSPKIQTVEELQGRRKALHIGMCTITRENLALTLQKARGLSKVLQQPTQSFSCFTPYCTNRDLLKLNKLRLLSPSQN